MILMIQICSHKSVVHILISALNKTHSEEVKKIIVTFFTVSLFQVSKWLARIRKATKYISKTICIAGVLANLGWSLPITVAHSSLEGV